MQQQYRNHRKFYVPHHFIFYPMLIALVIICIRQYSGYPNESGIWLAFAIVFMMLGWLSFMLRQHYALTLQNRLVRMEMRLRYYRLTNKALEDIEPRLSFGQLAALRFAPDEELIDLIERTLSSNLSADEIKKSIKNWLPDLMRV